jgi:hypothetical protein
LAETSETSFLLAERLKFEARSFRVSAIVDVTLGNKDGGE